MKIVVGLGNPGEKYEKNRHNAGFMVVDNIVKKLDIGDWVMDKKTNAMLNKTKDVIYVKPQTFMNDSGTAVAALVNFYKLDKSDLYVIHDDLDIALGSFKIQLGKGPKVHNGLKSIIEKLGTDQFWNVRIGVENRTVKGNKGIPGVKYSLMDFPPEEIKTIESVIRDATKELISRVVA